ncbi:peptidase domain-containing ABC transporter [Acidithiobacillus thiooxidans]|uniref:peptidase domain-containing ABC transporter n=1 Tax=Acidithiobacillus thiooxidans TaxID=930 RepID=UPI0009DABC23|nr:peptidase domain-containing ABC transporter [Acidithiobacillus thiooxidans]
MKIAQEILADLRFGFRRNVPMIQQSETAECGLACLAMIAGYHGYTIDLPSLRRRFGSSLKGVNLSQLIRMAAALRLECRALRLEPQDVSKLRMPCLLHWQGNHFVVLVAVHRQHVVIHDPARGMRVLTKGEFTEGFAGVAMELTPAANFQPAEQKVSISLPALTGPVHGLRGALMRIFILAFILELLGILGPFYMQWIIDEVLVINDYHLLTLLGIVYLSVTVFSALFSGLRSWVVIHINATLGVQWAANVFAHLMRLPQDFFEKRQIGDLVSRYGAIQEIRNTITTKLVSASLDGLLSVAILVVIAIYSLRLTAIVLVVFALYLLLRWMVFYPLRAATERRIFAAARQQTYLLESIRGIQTLKLFNRETERSAIFSNLLVETTNQNIRVQQLTSLFDVAQKFLIGIGHVVIIWIATLMVMHTEFTVGMLVAYATYASQFMSRGDGLINAWIEFRMLRLYGERLADIALTPPEAHREATYLGAEPKAELDLEGIHYRYAETDQWILQNLFLHVEAGSSIAIIGPSGNGKTTLVKVLLGLVTPEQGTICYGGVDLRHLGLQRYRGYISAVMQSDRLFAGSIANNIAFANPDTPLEKIIEAACLAGIHAEISAMTMGYETLVGDMGSTLSGGQQQRIFLARALLAKPRILILDEATSHLDPATEKQVNAHIRDLQITRIVIAHRPDTVMQCDRIYHLGEGHLTEIDREEYRLALWNSQQPVIKNPVVTPPTGRA